MGRDHSYSAKSGFAFREIANGTTANTDVNHNALSEFKPGDMVRTIIVLHHDNDQVDGCRVRSALPDHRHEWRIDRIDGTTPHLTGADVGDTVATALDRPDRGRHLQAALERLRAAVVAT